MVIIGYTIASMKIHKILLVVGVCLLLPATLLARPVRAVILPEITLWATEGKIGEFMPISGSQFTANSIIKLYFSSQKGDTKSSIDGQITIYKYLGVFFIDSDGKIKANSGFHIPDTLRDGKYAADVHAGDYYVYVIYLNSQDVEALAKFSVVLVTIIPPAITLSATPSSSSPLGKIGDTVQVKGSRFTANSWVKCYFSSQKVATKSSIDSQITVYKYLGWFFVDNAGNADANTRFKIPEALSDGKDKADVHGGDYYIYFTYYDKKEVLTITQYQPPEETEMPDPLPVFANPPQAFAKFGIVLSTIEIAPAEGKVNTPTSINGEGFRSGQKITVRYDGEKVAIASGDEKTDSAGRVNCRIIIPESTGGKHTVTITDESGNAPQTDFTVKSEIFLNPVAQSVDGLVEVSGTGFGERKIVSISLDGHTLYIPSAPVHTTRYGSFHTSFTLPFNFAYIDGGKGKITVTDPYNDATTDLTISPITPVIQLIPETTLASPGHVGMEITITGRWFPAQDTVKLTYEGEEKPLATVQVNADRSFSTRIIVSPGTGGEHKITATYGKTDAVAIFVMEQQAPPIPTLRSPEFTRASPDVPDLYWTEATDPSGITYTIQVARDTLFGNTLVEKKGLTTTRYLFTTEERRLLSEGDSTWYWRIKAIDGASNESEWSALGLFFVGSSWTQVPEWGIYIWTGLGLLLAIVASLWLRKRLLEKRHRAAQGIL